jgi:hypothetical protein
MIFFVVVVKTFWDEDPNQRRGAYNPTQLHTSWYLEAPVGYLKAWIQLKVIEIELQNTIVKFLQGLSWNYISMKSFLEYSNVSFILYATRDYGSRWKKTSHDELSNESSKRTQGYSLDSSMNESTTLDNDSSQKRFCLWEWMRYSGAEPCLVFCLLACFLPTLPRRRQHVRSRNPGYDSILLIKLQACLVFVLVNIDSI